MFVYSVGNVENVKMGEKVYPSVAIWVCEGDDGRWDVCSTLDERPKGRYLFWTEAVEAGLKMYEHLKKNAIRGGEDGRAA